MKQELLKNTLIIGVGRISTQMLVFLLLPLYTTFLSPEEYGIGELVITYTLLALPFVTLSLEQGAFRLLVDNRDNELKKSHIISFVFNRTILLTIIIGFLTIIVGYIFNISIIWYALVYAVSAIYLNIFLWIIRGLGNNLQYSVGSIIVGLLSLTLSILFIAFLDMGTNGMLMALSLANSVGILYFLTKSKIYKYIKPHTTDAKINKSLLNYSLPLVPNSVSWWIINAADRTIITIFLGVASAGIYAVAVKFPAILIGLFAIFWIAWHESASMHINNKDKDIFFSDVMHTTIILFGSIALLIVATLSVIFDIIIGSAYDEAYLYIPILMAGALFHSISTMQGSIYAAKQQTRKILNTTIYAAVINILLMIVLIQFIGLFGASFAVAVAYLAMVIFRHRDINKFIKIKVNRKEIFILILASIPTITLYYINNVYLNYINIIYVALFLLFINKKILMALKGMLWAKVKF